MRRDYFTCVFLLHITVALCFVVINPLYFVYGNIVVRDFSLLEKISSLVYSVVAIIAIPVISALKKRLWVVVGTCCYGAIAYIPGIFLSGMESSVAGSKASTLGVLKAEFLRDVYGLVTAPFAGISGFVGDKFAERLPRLILPISIIVYVLIQIVRFYRDAYLAQERMKDIADKKQEPSSGPTREPEILGTVISAPVTSATTSSAPIRVSSEVETLAASAEDTALKGVVTDVNVSAGNAESVVAPESVGVPESAGAPESAVVPESVGVPGFTGVPESVEVPEFTGAPESVGVPGFTGAPESVGSADGTAVGTQAVEAADRPAIEGKEKIIYMEPKNDSPYDSNGAIRL